VALFWSGLYKIGDPELNQPVSLFPESLFPSQRPPVQDLFPQMPFQTLRPSETPEQPPDPDPQPGDALDGKAVNLD
jgi:hypothetical protein